MYELREGGYARTIEGLKRKKRGRNFYYHYTLKNTQTHRVLPCQTTTGRGTGEKVKVINLSLAITFLKDNSTFLTTYVERSQIRVLLPDCEGT